jgi:hypothetical protein
LRCNRKVKTVSWANDSGTYCGRHCDGGMYATKTRVTRELFRDVLAGAFSLR